MPRDRITTVFDSEDRTTGVLNQVNAGLGRFASFAFSPAGVVAGAGAIAGAVVGLTAEYQKEADALSKLSQRTGQRTEELGAIKFAYEQADLSASDLERTYARLNEQDLRLDQVADEIAGIEDVTERTNRLIEIFGERLGPRLATVLSQGSEGLDAYRQRHRDLNLTISQESADAAAALNDNMDNIGRALRGAGRRVGEIAAQTFGPAIVSLAQTFDVIPMSADEETEYALELLRDKASEAHAAGLTFGQALSDPIITELRHIVFEAGYTVDQVSDIFRQGPLREQYLGYLELAENRAFPTPFSRYQDTFTGPERIFDRYTQVGQTPVAPWTFAGPPTLYGYHAGASPDPTDYQSIFTATSDPFDVIGRAERFRALSAALQAASGGGVTYGDPFAIGGGAASRHQYTAPTNVRALSELFRGGRGGPPGGANSRFNAYVQRLTGSGGGLTGYDDIFAVGGGAASRFANAQAYNAHGEFSPVPVDLPTDLRGASGGIRIDGQSLLDASKSNPMSVFVAGVANVAQERRSAEFSFNPAGQLENQGFSSYLESLRLFGQI